MFKNKFLLTLLIYIWGIAISFVIPYILFVAIFKKRVKSDYRDICADLKIASDSISDEWKQAGWFKT